MKITHVTPASKRIGNAWLPRLDGRTRAVLHWAAFGITWGLLALFAFVTGMAIGWLLLAAVVLGAGPSFADLEIALPVLILTVVLAWLAGKLAGSMRKAGLFVGGVIGLVLIGFAIWAPAYPVKALYLARQIAWGPSDVTDYLDFPERAVANAAPNFHFKEAADPGLFKMVEYTSGGETRQADLEKFLESTNTTSFIVIKDDTILYEGYFNGYERDSIVTSFSMAKSFTSALVGIAIEEGYIGGVDDLMIEYLPEMKGRGLDDLTIRHLLNMSTGIRYDSDDEISFVQDMFQFTDDGKSYSYPDLRDQALNLQPSKEPVGAEFNYNNYHPQLLGMILERTTGMPPATYLQEKIWKPLGMEYPASWSLDSEKSGFELMTAGINGRAIDFARFGRLFLNKGNWEGSQVIPEAWVQESTSPDPADNRPWHSYIDWQEAGGYYRYLWWGVFRPDGGYDFAAHGHLGQLIYVAPKERMIVVRFGIDEGGVDWWDQVARGLIDQAAGTPEAEGPAGMRRVTTEEKGFDSGKLAKGLLEIQKKGIAINSLMMIHNDEVFLDAYFYPYDGSIYHDLASVTKSVTTTLIGIAAGQGKLDLDSPVLSFFPGYTFANLDERKERMTVRDLASMRSGLECGYNDDEPTLKEMRATQDWVQFALDQPMKNEPGKYFSYCGMSMHLLSAIVTQVTGMPALEYAKANLFGPLGIEEVYWPADPQGNNHGWGDLSLYPSDMAKLGTLFLHRGRWGEQQIFPAEWVDEAMQPYSTITGRKEYYGYGWWISPEGEDPAYFLAAGNSGQRIQVFPDRDLIFVTTGSGFEFDQVVPYIVAALADGPLPPNPAGQDKLEEALKTIVKGPAPKAVPPLPEIASAVSGKTFVFGPECGIMRSASLDLEDPAEAVFTLDVVNEPYPRVSGVGLDGILRKSRAGRPVLARGEWWDAHTFAIEYYEGPGISYLKFVFHFKEDGGLILDLAGIAKCEGRME